MPQRPKGVDLVAVPGWAPVQRRRFDAVMTSMTGTGPHIRSRW